MDPKPRDKRPIRQVSDYCMSSSIVNMLVNKKMQEYVKLWRRFLESRLVQIGQDKRSLIAKYIP